MKKCMYLLIPSLFLIFISCSKSSTETTDVITNSLVAKWKYNGIKTNGIVSQITTCDKNGYVVFNTNGTFERKDYYFSENNNTCVLEGDEKGTYTYSSSTNKIVLKFTDPYDGAQVETWNNVKFTNSSLDFTWDENNDGKDEHAVSYIK